MKAKLFPCVLGLCLSFGLMTACGSSTASSAPAEEAPASAAVSAVETETPSEAPVVESVKEESVVEEPSVVEESVVEEPSEPVTCTITFSTGETFEATVGEDFVFFWQCDAPGDMGEPEEGQEGAGITVSDGTVAYDNVSLGGPYSYPTSEKVTISGFTGDVTVTVTDAATVQNATYTIYTDEQEIADAVAFAEQMDAQRAENPMP